MNFYPLNILFWWISYGAANKRSLLAVSINIHLQTLVRIHVERLCSNERPVEVKKTCNGALLKKPKKRRWDSGRKKINVDIDSAPL